jgi:hypothetical protein
MEDDCGQRGHEVLLLGGGKGSDVNHDENGETAESDGVNQQAHFAKQKAYRTGNDLSLRLSTA